MSLRYVELGKGGSDVGYIVKPLDGTLRVVLILMGSGLIFRVNETRPHLRRTSTIARTARKREEQFGVTGVYRRRRGERPGPAGTTHLAKHDRYPPGEAWSGGGSVQSAGLTDRHTGAACTASGLPAQRRTCS
jgi:hypothetical protein